MSHLPRTILCCLALLLAALPARAQDDLVQRLQERYEAIQSFTTDVTQVLTNAASGQQETRSGEIAFSQPRLIRWETTEPEKELLVVGEDVVWNYFPEEGVAYRYPVSQVLQTKTMIRFVSGQARLDQDFYIDAQDADGDLVKLSLTPKEAQPTLVQAFVWVAPDEALIRKVTLVDFYANENTLIFEAIRINPELSPDLFRFAPPAGVEVFDNAPQN